jgi:hypothetical protein
LALLIGISPAIGSRSESSFYSAAAATERFSQILYAFAGLFNALAFSFALTSAVKRVPGVPWVILVVSGVAVFFCCAVVYSLIFGLPAFVGINSSQVGNVNRP